MRATPGRIAAFVLGLVVVAALKTLESSPLTAQSQALTAEGLERSAGIAYNGLVSFLAGGASVMPGLDGSLVLILGGTYRPVLSAVSELSHLSMRWGALLSTGIGAAAGILAFSKGVDALLKRAPSLAYYGVLGLLGGAIYSLLPRDTLGIGVPILVAAAATGFALARWLAHATRGANETPTN
jgi:uncharacterized membrane protein